MLKWLGSRGGRDLQVVILLKKRNAGSVVVAYEVVGTLNHYKMVKKLNFVH